MEDSNSCCDYCESDCPRNEIIQLFTPLPFGRFCRPECAAAFNEYNCSINDEIKQERHARLEKYWKRTILILPKDRIISTEDVLKEKRIERFRK
jgi:hypothetical protein